MSMVVTARKSPRASPLDLMTRIRRGSSRPVSKRSSSPLGKTTVFGEYRNDEAGANQSITIGGVNQGNIRGSDLDFWAAGVVQNIENAAMDLYVIYRHSEGDVDTAVGGNFAVDDFDMLISGARIQF